MMQRHAASQQFFSDHVQGKEFVEREGSERNHRKRPPARLRRAAGLVWGRAMQVVSRAAERFVAARPDQQKFRGYFWSAMLVAICTVVNIVAIQPHLPLRNVVMIYLLGVIVAAIGFGRGPSALAAILSVATFDFVFVSPAGAVRHATTPDVITFAVMLAIGLMISTLTGRVGFQVRAARERERRMAALFAMSGEFATLRSREEIALAAERHIGAAVAGEAVVRLVDDPRSPSGGSFPRWTPDEQAVFERVVQHSERASAPSGEAGPTTYLPLSAAHGCLGVLRLKLPQPGRHLAPEHEELLKTLTGLTALAIERACWVEAAEQARLDTEAERLRNALLSSVSHDLRTPLAAIVGSSSTLVEMGEQLGPSVRRDMAEAILDEGERLNRQVANLLDMTRLGNGSLQAHKELEPIDEVIGVVLDRLQRLLKAFPVETRLEPDLPAVPMDDRLIQQVLVNLLENAIKYSPPGTPIELSAWREGDDVAVEVADRGPGMAQRDLGCAFNRFYRAPLAADAPGVGLGLTICRGILSLHDGQIDARNRPGGGLAVRFQLPIAAVAPGDSVEGSPDDAAAFPRSCEE